MPKHSFDSMRDTTYTQNRDLSWLYFNRRVLDLAGSPSVPPLERLRFLSIFTHNLDEFFMTRVGHLLHQSVEMPNQRDSKTGQTYNELLHHIYGAIPPLLLEKNRIYQSLCLQLKQYGLENVPLPLLHHSEREFLSLIYTTQIQPNLSTYLLNHSHTFPHLDNLHPAVALLLLSPQGEKVIGLVPFPATASSCFLLPGSPGRYLSLEQLLLHQCSHLFPEYLVLEYCVIRITRNADLPIHGGYNQPQQIEHLIRQRAQQEAVRLELSRRVSQFFLDNLLSPLHLRRFQVYEDFTPLDLQNMIPPLLQVPIPNRETLLYQPYLPRLPQGLDSNRSMFDQIQQQDRLLFYPYHSFHPFLLFLQEAAHNPDSKRIQITLYRLAPQSQIVHTLCQAAKNGKQVIVVVELRARFDEIHNLTWAKTLQKSGCEVHYGPSDYKCHRKVCLVTLRRDNQIRYLTQIGTGNYNEETCTQYTDLCYLTANQEIGSDCARFFLNVCFGTLYGSYHHLWVSPLGIYYGLLQEIQQQIDLGSQGYICIKANAITNRSLIDKLQEANQAGVEIHLIVRGSCCLRPGIPGKTDHIHVTRLVGRFLEHARIYCFGREPQARYFISSADLMNRNLRRRVEIACPIYDPSLKSQLAHILHAQLADTVNTQSPSQSLPYDSQKEFMDVPY